MIKDYTRGLLQMKDTVEVLNQTYDKEEVEIDDLYGLSTDETETHRIVSIYEVLGGSCLISIKFDKETGELSKSSDSYVDDQFGGYTDESAVNLLNVESEIDFDVICVAAYVAGMSFAGSREERRKFTQAAYSAFKQLAK